MAEPDVTALLVDEAQRAGDKISDLVLVDERMLATGVTLLGAAASVAIGSGKTYLLMGLPFALATLLCFVEFLHTNLMALGGYKAVLEEAIAERVGAPVIAWETGIAPTIHWGRTGWATRGLIGVFFLISVFAAIQQALTTRTPGNWGHHHSTVLVALTVGSIAIGLVAMGVAGWAVTHEYERAKSLARETLLPKWLAPKKPTMALTSQGAKGSPTTEAARLPDADSDSL